MTDTTLLHFRRRAPKVTRAVPNVIRKLCRHRSSKRWSSLLTQTRSRIGHDFGMRERLGEANWHAFVRYAVQHHKAAFLSALVPPPASLDAERVGDETPSSSCIPTLIFAPARPPPHTGHAV